MFEVSHSPECSDALTGSSTAPPSHPGAVIKLPTQFYQSEQVPDQCSPPPSQISINSFTTLAIYTGPPPLRKGQLYSVAILFAASHLRGRSPALLCDEIHIFSSSPVVLLSWLQGGDITA
jgi:hypothetical protein